mgnify:FL=1
MSRDETGVPFPARAYFLVTSTPAEVPVALILLLCRVSTCHDACQLIPASRTLLNHVPCPACPPACTHVNPYLLAPSRRAHRLPRRSSTPGSLVSRCARVCGLRGCTLSTALHGCQLGTRQCAAGNRESCSLANLQPRLIDCAPCLARVERRASLGRN